MKDMISGIESRFFEGPENKGKNPKYSLTDLDNENFRLVTYELCVLHLIRIRYFCKCYLKMNYNHLSTQNCW